MAVNRLHYVLGVVLFTKPFNFMTFDQLYEIATEKAYFSTFMYKDKVTLKIAVVPEHLKDQTDRYYYMLIRNPETGKELVLGCKETSGHLPYKGDFGKFDIEFSPIMAYGSFKLKYLVSKLWD